MGKELSNGAKCIPSALFMCRRTQKPMLSLGVKPLKIIAKFSCNLGSCMCKNTGLDTDHYFMLQYIYNLSMAYHFLSK